MYPVTCILNTTLRNYVGEAIKWKVTARSNWMLTHLLSGLDVCYLFWEAETQHKETISPVSPSSAITASAEKEINHDKRFVPGESKCSPSNSVMLSVEVVPIYFDKSFGVLGLHTEVRTSFITYWLPFILKHKYIALSFLPQAAYEESTPLDIVPVPDIVTRVFMLFQGVEPSDVDGLWQEAQYRAGQPATMWKEIVGIDEVK